MLKFLEDILIERYTRKDTVMKDNVMMEANHKIIIFEVEDEVLANARVDIFKLYDENESKIDKKYFERDTKKIYLKTLFIKIIQNIKHGL